MKNILLFHFLPTLKQLISSLRLNSSDVLDKYFFYRTKWSRRSVCMNRGKVGILFGEIHTLIHTLVIKPYT